MKEGEVVSVEDINEGEIEKRIKKFKKKNGIREILGGGLGINIGNIDNENI